MKKLNIVAQKINDFIKVNDSLVGKHVLVKHQTYPEIQDIVKKVKKIPGVNTKQVTFEDAQPILIRKGDKFNIEVLGFKSNKFAQEKGRDLEKKIVEFFKKNPNPPDSEVHAFSETLNMDEHDLEGEIYKLFGSLMGYGESIEYKGNYDPEQLRMGVEEEMKEHTNNPLIALKIATDHLSKIKDYYTRLKKMENEALRELNA